MTLPCPAASRPKVPLLAALGAGVGLFLSHPAHAATEGGDLLTSNRTALLDDGRQIRASVLRHTLVQATGGAREDGMWTSTWGHWGDHDGNASAARLRSNGGGVVGGIDREVGDLHVGGLVGAGNLTARGPGGVVQAQSSVVGGYVAGQQGHWEWQGGASYTWSQMDSHRRTPGAVAEARYGGGIAQAWVDGGYRFATPRGSVTPFVNLARAQLFQDAITESNSPAALRMDGTHGHVDIGTVGVRGAMQFQDGVVGHAGIGYQHAWGDDVRPTDTQRLIPDGDPMRAIGVPTPRNAAVADVGIAFATSKGTSVDASYRGMFGGGTKDQALRVSVTIKW